MDLFYFRHVYFTFPSSPLNQSSCQYSASYNYPSFSRPSPLIDTWRCSEASKDKFRECVYMSGMMLYNWIDSSEQTFFTEPSMMFCYVLCVSSSSKWRCSWRRNMKTSRRSYGRGETWKPSWWVPRSRYSTHETCYITSQGLKYDLIYAVWNDFLIITFLLIIKLKCKSFRC